MIPWQIILASESKYKQRQMAQLGIPFASSPPLIDEEKEKDLSLNPGQLAQSLAQKKARSLKSLLKPHTIIIGTDQLVHLEGEILGKPHNPTRAKEQLKKMQGKEHFLLTALTVLHYQGEVNHLESCLLRMRPLSDQQINFYLDLDKAFDCAGSYKIEEHGLVLFEKIDTKDFSSIQGLPLIALANILNQIGVPLLQ